MDRIFRSLQAVAICAASACAPTWQHAVITSQVLAVGALACDGGTTEQFLDARAYYENNPLLGPTPSPVRLWTYLGVLAVAVVASNRVLPAKWALVANTAVIGFESYSIAHNMSVGSSACGLGDGGPWATARTR